MTKSLEVVAAVIVLNDRVLLARRNKGHLNGYWEFPGGKIEPGESPAAALERELMEEFGVEVSVGPKIMTVHYEYPEKTIALSAFWTKPVRGKFKLVDHSVIGWCTLKEALDFQLAPADVPIAEKIAAEGIPNGF